MEVVKDFEKRIFDNKKEVKNWICDQELESGTLFWTSQDAETADPIAICTYVNTYKIPLYMEVVSTDRSILDQYLLHVDWQGKFDIDWSLFKDQLEKVIWRVETMFGQGEPPPFTEVRQAAIDLVKMWHRSDLSVAMQNLSKLVVKSENYEVEQLMENDVANEHILVGLERKKSASLIEDVIECHGLDFTLSTIGRILETDDRSYPADILAKHRVTASVLQGLAPHTEE
jgi:hypothetical protein